MLTQEEKLFIVNTTQVVGLSLSLFAASIVVLIILIAMFLDRKLMDRVSIRFTLAISLVDITIAAITIREYIKPTEVLSCIIGDNLIFFCSQFYLFLYAAIAFNLQLVFINGVRVKPRMELYYWVVVVMIPFFLTVINAIYGFESCYDVYDPELKPVEETKKIVKVIDPIDVRAKEFALEWGLNYMWSFFLCIYCVGVFVIIIDKIRDNKKKLSKVIGSTSTSWQSMRYSSAVTTIIYRIGLYCMIPIIFNIATYVSSIYYLITGRETFPIFFCTRFSEGLPGILNLIVFMCDPVFPQALQTIYRHFPTWFTQPRSRHHSRSSCSAIPLDLPSSRDTSLYDSRPTPSPPGDPSGPSSLTSPPPSSATIDFLTSDVNSSHGHRPTASYQSFLKRL